MDERATFLQRTIHQENKRFRVSVAVPSPEEAAQLFDRGLHKEGIQPVWLRIENRLATTAYFLPNLIDSDYYAPLEVAYQYHSGWRPKRNAAKGERVAQDAVAAMKWLRKFARFRD